MTPRNDRDVDRRTVLFGDLDFGVFHRCIAVGEVHGVGLELDTPPPDPIAL